MYAAAGDVRSRASDARAEQVMLNGHGVHDCFVFPLWSGVRTDRAFLAAAADMRMFCGFNSMELRVK